ncbi:hypothetical protein ACWCQZ_02795 [Streptomyces sp. NPDC002285]
MKDRRGQARRDPTRPSSASPRERRSTVAHPRSCADAGGHQIEGNNVNSDWRAAARGLYGRGWHA